ncbi:MAG: hypothetical protein AAF772_20025, partial [Acidobacteriota bacterium]
AARRAQLGPYELHTNLAAEDPLLPRLDAIASSIASVYRARYGLTPLGAPTSVIALFDDLAGYRALQMEDPALVALADAGAEIGGHAGGGVAAVWRGGRADDVVASTLIHELVHTLNRRALGPALPPWLEEGLAEELALSAVDRDGRIDPARLSGTTQRTALGTRETIRDGLAMRTTDVRIDHTGGLAVVTTLRTAQQRGRLVSLGALVQLDQQAFVGDAQRRLHYGQAGLWLRALLSEPATEATLRAYLAGVADGAPATGEALRMRLDRPWTALDAAFHAWLDARAASLDSAP